MRVDESAGRERLCNGRALFVISLAAAGIFSVGCASGQAAREGAQSPRSAGAISAVSSKSSRSSAIIEVPEITVSPYDDEQLAAEVEKGRSLLLAEKVREASAIFDRLLHLSPDGPVAPPSLLYRGIAHEGLGERDLAVGRYRELLRRFPDQPAARVGRVRLARQLAYLERWSELVAVADQILATGDLSPLEVIEARGSRALGLALQDNVEEASREVLKARDLIEEHRLGEAGRPPVELAPVAFALGEVRRIRSESIRFTPLPPNFTEMFEQRCQGLLEAQNAYTDAMRAFDPHWSAMAGYRVGQLYEQLHRDVMQISPPKTAETLRQKQLFEGVMRLRYRVLLEKGLTMMDGVVRMGERTGEASQWVGRAREAKEKLELALAEEKAALAKLPFTEAELQQGLDGLKKKK